VTVRNYRNSEITDYQRCRKKWNWRWNEGYTPKRQNGKLFFGVLFHKFLEVLYKTSNRSLAQLAMEKEFQDTNKTGTPQQEIDEVWNMANIVAENYVTKWWDNDQHWEIIATEFEFEVPIDDQITYVGTIDLIFQYKGKIWFMDHKTTSSLDIYENNSRMDRQISRYWWALKKLGYDVGGFIYNIILKDYPVPPKKLKNGKFSTAKNQNTTYELYVEAIQENKFEELDYFDILHTLKNQPREYFRRVNVTRNDAELANAMFEFYQAALEASEIKDVIDANGESPRVYRNITKDCSWDCPFMDACKADMDGSNIEFLMNMAFNKEEVK
jgi:RecB family exonuclease